MKLSNKQTWKVKEAQEAIADIREDLSALGWGVALAGSLAYKSSSPHDADFLLFPWKTKAPGLVHAHKEVLDLFCKKLGFFVWGVCDHSLFGDDKLIYVLLHWESKKRVDLFFPTLTFAERSAERVLKRKP